MCFSVHAVSTTSAPSTRLYHCAQARIAWIEVRSDQGYLPVLERALEVVQVAFAERCSAHIISTGRSWDEYRAAARVLRPGAVRLHAPTSGAAFHSWGERVGRARRQVS